MNTIICADALDGLKVLEDESVDMCVTSPPYYGLRDYGTERQIGMEECPQEYVKNPPFRGRIKEIREIVELK